MRALQEFPSDKPEIEYLDGRPYPKVSPKLDHGRAQCDLAGIIADCAGDRGEIASEWRCRPGALDHTKTEFVPDLAYASFDRLDAIGDEEAQEPPFSPELIVEIRSPGDNLRYLRSKIERYLRTGAELVLDVDTRAEVIHAHTRDGAQLFKNGEHFRHAVMPWLQFDIEALFKKRKRKD